MFGVYFFMGDTVHEYGLYFAQRLEIELIFLICQCFPGSSDERRVVKFVNQFSSRAEDNIYDMDVLKDVEFKFVPPKTARLGEAFELRIRMRSKSESVRNVDVKISLMSSFYTGVSRQKIKSKHQMMELLPSGGKLIFYSCSKEKFGIDNKLVCTGWNDKIVVRKKTTLQLYFKTFIEKINSGNLII